MVRFWNSKAFCWAAPLAWMGVIFCLSAQSTLPSLTPGLPGFQDIAGHLTAYAILAVLYRHALAHAGMRRAGWWALALCVLYGVTDEFHQSFVPGRNPDVFDLAMDTSGASAALLLSLLIPRARFALHSS